MLDWSCKSAAQLSPNWADLHRLLNLGVMWNAQEGQCKYIYSPVGYAELLI